jgi:hypothetical protein
LFPKRILSKEKTRSAFDFGGMAFPPTEYSLSEVADIAVADGKATGSSDVGGKVAL